MVWPDKRYDVEDDHPFGHDRPADSVRFNEALFGTYRDLIALRREHDALRRGSFGVVQADDERSLFTYARTHPSDTLLVTLNRSAAAHSARVPLPDSLQRPYEVLRTVPEGASVRLQEDGTALLLEVPGHTGVVVRPAP
jgi:glycosidase